MINWNSISWPSQFGLTIYFVFIVYFIITFLHAFIGEEKLKRFKVSIFLIIIISFVLYINFIVFHFPSLEYSPGFDFTKRGISTKYCAINNNFYEFTRSFSYKNETSTKEDREYIERAMKRWDKNCSIGKRIANPSSKEAYLTNEYSMKAHIPWIISFLYIIISLIKFKELNNCLDLDDESNRKFFILLIIMDLIFIVLTYLAMREIIFNW